MSKIEYIIEGFGLKALNAQQYRENQGEPLSPAAADYQVEEPERASNLLGTGATGVLRQSYLGTPVFADLVLRSDDADTGIYFDTVLITVSQTKNIVKTSVNGRNGTFKEYIADGDYDIDIKGAITSQFSTEYPLDAVTEFVRRMKIPQSIQLISPFLQIYDIYDFVVESYSTPQVEGVQNTQLFEIKGVSDLPLELIEQF